VKENSPYILFYMRTIQDEKEENKLKALNIIYPEIYFRIIMGK